MRIYIVMDGNYEPSVDSVFTDETAANRRSAALREGRVLTMDADTLTADDYLYRVDYDPSDDHRSTWLASEISEIGGTDGVDRLEDSYCRTYVRAKTHDEAERLGMAKIRVYLGIEEVSE